MVFWNNTPYAARGVNTGATAENGPGIQYTVAAYLYIVTQHGTDLFSPSGDFFPLVVDHDKGLVASDITGDAAGTHMALIAQDRVSYIIEMGHLHMIKKDNIFKLGGIAYHAFPANQRVTADKGAVANLGFVIDDAGTMDVGAGKHDCILSNPYVLLRMVIFLGGKGSSQF